MIQLGDRSELEVKRLGIHGEGISDSIGITLFVEGALPGERVLAEVFEVKRSYARAKVVEILRRSPLRQEPLCPLFGRCGGCQLLHLRYSAQLEMKRQRVADALSRIGGIVDPIVADCAPSPRQLGYRNKIQLPCTKSDPVQLGLYARKTHDLIPVERCYIHCAEGERVFARLQELMRAVPCGGKIKHLLIKSAIRRGEVLVILVSSTPAEPIHALLAERIRAEIPGVRGVLLNHNPSSGNTILGRTYHLLAGDPFVEEEILGCAIKLSAAAFCQVNLEQAEQLYRKALALCALQGDERVLDAYCGVGVLSLLMAKQAREVVGVEYVAEAIEDAKENARANGISNARFLAAPVEEAILTIAEVDLALLNPPRKGCDPLFLSRLAALSPRKIVYISCDPATLARDIQLLCREGYRFEGAYPFDMFPQTAHVECIVLLERTNG